jgi:hypothetical protein
MKKTFWVLLLCWLSQGLFAQNIVTNGIKFYSAPTQISKWSLDLNSLDSLSNTAVPTAKAVYDLIKSKHAPNFSIPGPITSVPTIGMNVQGANAEEWIRSAFYQSQAPTLSLSGGDDQELMAAGADQIRTVTYAAGRLSGTLPLENITVDGVIQSFSQPAQPGTVTGNQSVSVQRNVNKTITASVITTDGKTASASTVYRWFPKNYWFTLTGETPINSDLLNGYGGGDGLTSTRSKSNFSITVGSTPSRIAYAYPASLGPLTSMVVGGFESINTFTLTVLPFTNARGFTQNYNVYVSKNVFDNITITFNSVN